jgi:hypothetical protein
MNANLNIIGMVTVQTLDALPSRKIRATRPAGFGGVRAIIVPDFGYCFIPNKKSLSVLTHPANLLHLLLNRISP